MASPPPAGLGRGQTLAALGKRNLIGQIRPIQRLDKQEPKRCGLALDGARRKLAIAKQMNLILANMIRPKLVWRAAEIPDELLDRVQVRSSRMRRIVATLELIQHLLAKQGKRIVERTIADHLLFQARTLNSCDVGIEVDGGRSPEDSRFRFEITGDRGTIMLQGGAAVGFQAGRLTLSITGKSEAVAEGDASQLPEFAANVGSMYAALRDDIAYGQRTVPDFDHAVRLTRLLTDAGRSSESGVRSQAADWPKS